MFTNLLHKRTSIVSFVFKCGLLKSLSIIISLSPTYTKQKHRLATCLINCIISRHPRVGRGRHQFFSDGKYHCSTSGQATSALTMRSRTSGSPRGGRRPKRKFVSTWFEFLFKQHWQWKKLLFKSQWEVPGTSDLTPRLNAGCCHLANFMAWSHSHCFWSVEKNAMAHNGTMAKKFRVTTLQTMWNSLTIPGHFPDSSQHCCPC